MKSTSPGLFFVERSSIITSIPIKNWPIRLSLLIYWAFLDTVLVDYASGTLSLSASFSVLLAVGSYDPFVSKASIKIFSFSLLIFFI